MIGDIGFPELLIVLVIILLLFGVGRVSKVGKELGSAISEFRKGLNEREKEDQPAPESKASSTFKG
jgi:sec-independent protein translocase protein TatA